MSRRLVDLGHSLLEIHVMLHCKHFATTEEWRASGRPLSRPTDFESPPRRFTAADIRAHMKRRGSLSSDRRLASTSVEAIHEAMRKLCHGFPSDDLRFDEKGNEFWYQPFRAVIRIE